MSPVRSIRAAALVLFLPSASSFAAPQASPPHLRHSAPFVGQTLDLEVEGAVPNATVDLLWSSASGTFQTPYGVLELRRNGVQRVASGTASATGSCSFQIQIPLDPALAETETHYQAIADDPSAPAGRVLSDAVHARLLGPRVYAGYQGEGNPARTGLYVLSGVTRSVVVQVDFGLTGPSSGSKPVFDPTFSRGAAMSTARELLFFDPFFGGVKARIPFASDCSSTLLQDSTGESVFVLETGTPPRVHAIDIVTGTETAHLDLPNAATSLWCAGQAGSEAFLAEFEAGGRTAVRHVGLDPLADLGSAAVGAPNSDVFESLAYSGGQAFASTRGDLPPPAVGTEGFLTRCQVTPSGLAARAMRLGQSRMYLLTPVPAADRLLAGQMMTNWGPAGWLCQVPISRIAPPALVGNSELYVHDIGVDGTVAWMIAESEWQHADSLYRLDVQSLTWTVLPYFWNFGPSDLEILGDAWNHEVWVSNRGVPPPVGIAPEILVLDELNGSTQHIPLGRTATFLHAVPLP